MNRTFVSLNLDYRIDNFNIRKGELVVNNVFLKSRVMDALVEDDNLIYNIE